MLGVCGGGCEEDLNENGICDDQEVLGCMDCTACNFDEAATVDVGCEYAELGYDCAGVCIWDDDGDGVCDTEEILGCQDEARATSMQRRQTKGFVFIRKNLKIARATA